jgi:iron complex transport system permease protein
MMDLTYKRWITLNVWGIAMSMVATGVFLFCGEPFISPSVLWDPEARLEREILLMVRLPRALLGLVVGAGLSTSGAAFQALLRNSLADPYILGVSSGAALGGVLAYSLQLPYEWAPVAAFLAGLGTLFLIFFLSNRGGFLPVHSLLLTGVVFNSFSFAVILLLNALAPMGEAHQIFFLLLGSLEAQSLSSVVWVAVPVIVGVVALVLLSPAMNLVSLGEETAQQLGLNVARMRKIIFFAASLIVGACVASAGLIGFVGLFVPHMARLRFGPDHRVLLPVAAWGGGAFLVLCDWLSKELLTQAGMGSQLPVGVITALIGGPYFFYLMRRSA